ncbi:UNVERIFIED_CONTAM: hypothetical protein FKN15_069939 [Acipenser sinensis]
MNTRCPPKRVPSADCFFSHCGLTMQPPKSYSIGGQCSSRAAYRQARRHPARLRGRWCAVSQGQPGRPSPPSPRAAHGQLSAAPWKLPSSVSKGIAWTQTRECSHPRATASEDNAALGQLTGKHAGIRPDSGVAGVR